MPRLSRRLLLPLLLLVPLGVLKWRADQSKEWQADHPSLSKTDRKIRVAIDRFAEVRILGSGPLWHKLTGLDGKRHLLVRDRVALDELKNALRCADDALPKNQDALEGCALGDTILLRIPTDKTGVLSWGVLYWHDSAHSYVNLGDEENAGILGWNRCLVNPRFVPRFQALLSHLAQEAKSKGHHPQLMIKADSDVPQGTRGE